MHLTISVILKAINSQKHILTEVGKIYNETSGKSFPMWFFHHKNNFLITNLILHISRNNFIVLFLIKSIYVMNLLLLWSLFWLAFLWNPYHPYVHHRFKGQPKWWLEASIPFVLISIVLHKRCTPATEFLNCKDSFLDYQCSHYLVK